MAVAVPPIFACEFLLALRNVKAAEAKAAIYKLAEVYDGKDRFYLAALAIAAGHDDEARRAVLVADFDKHFPEQNQKVLDLRKAWQIAPAKP